MKSLINTLLGKKKTLVAILNYNLPDVTDQLFDMLKPHEKNIYDVIVIDNGSPKGGKPNSTTHHIEKNCYFGGGLNYAFKLVLDNKTYDSLLFLNNDLIVHGHSFVSALRDEMVKNDHAVLSPCILQPQVEQLYWKAMQNWGSTTTRLTKWVDFQAPMIHRKVIERINQYPSELNLGYGSDVYTGMICDEEGWTVGVCDWIPAIHFHSLTFKKDKAPMSSQSHADKAIKAMDTYFESIGKKELLREFRKHGKTYQFKG